MIRTALRPRWLAWLVVTLAALAVCVQLGRWQMDVAHQKATRDALVRTEAQPVRPLGEVLAPHAPWDGRVLANRKVSAVGSYEGAGQFLVPDRYLQGRRGYWVVAPFRTTSPAGVIAVVRGWVPTASAPAVPTGERTLTGTLAQGESPVDVGSAALPAGQEGSIDLARLVNEWDGELYNAFAFAATETPADAAAPTRVPPPQPESGVNLRNAAYAVQWWVFGAFCPLLWFLMVRTAHAAETQASRPVGAGPDPADDPDTPTTGA